MKKSFNKSQSQHRRLLKMHRRMYDKTGKDIHWICTGYHNDVLRKQSSLGRLLTFDEKKRVFKNNEYYFYN